MQDYCTLTDLSRRTHSTREFLLFDTKRPTVGHFPKPPVAHSWHFLRAPHVLKVLRDGQAASDAVFEEGLVAFWVEG